MPVFQDAVPLNLSLPRNKYLVSEITQLFQMSVPNGAFAEVRSSAPVQAMGITADAAGTAMPVVPTGLSSNRSDGSTRYFRERARSRSSSR
jgi:hypothetical protein